MNTSPTIPTGFLLIDKPVNWTSHDVVGCVRRTVRQSTGIKKIRVGHAGTLDPFATGLLIIGIGRAATKNMDKFVGLPKTYETTIQLGSVSDTYDTEGKITKCDNNLNITKKDIRKILKQFTGQIAQVPPMHSAKKVNGKKLYDLAREGKVIERKPCQVHIYNLKLTNFDSENQLVSLRCKVSKGTYIRSLAHDIGQALGTGAYCKTLRRTKIGKYSAKKATAPKSITTDNWVKRLI